MVEEVSISDLETWLGEQTPNTPETPYELSITGITQDDLVPYDSESSICTKLRNFDNIYVDLSATIIPEGVTSMEDCLNNTPIVKAPVIPNTVTTLSGCFSACRYLTTPPVIPNSVQDMSLCFLYCTGLEIAPVIPNSVTNMFSCFNGCTGITVAPNIPSTVSNILECFEGCINLTTWTQNSIINPTIYNNMFMNCTRLKSIHTDVPYETKFFLTTLYNASTNNFPNDPDTCSFTPCSEVVEIPFSNLNNELSAFSNNTRSSPYKIKVTELVAGNLGSSQTNGTLGYVIKNNNSIYIDLRETVLPATSTMKKSFYDIQNMVYAPDIPNGVIDLEECFCRCGIATSPNISNTVLSMKGCFSYCSFTSFSNFPNSVTNLEECFYDSGITSVTNIPNTVTNMSSCFAYCTSLHITPLLPDSVVDMTGCFYYSTVSSVTNIPPNVTNMEDCFERCEYLEEAPIIPNGVINMNYCYSQCDSLITIPNVPSSVETIINCFSDCDNLEEITLFEADLKELVLNNKAKYAFSGSFNLVRIGVKDAVSEVPWHVYRLKFDSNSVQGKVYDKDGNSVSIAQTSITKDTLTLPVKTDELWFPDMTDPDFDTDAKIDAIIEAVIANKYTYFKKEVLDPTKKSFVLWADDPDNFTTNVPITAVDVVQKGNMSPVSSNATALAIDSEATARDTAISNAVKALDKASVGGSGKYISAIEEVDGKINATASNLSSATVGDSDKVDGYHVSTASGTTKNDALNALVPVVKQYFTSTSGYIVYANGLKIQWGRSSVSNEKITIDSSKGLLSYSGSNTYIVMATKDSGSTAGTSDYDVRVYEKTASSFKMYVMRSPDIQWFCIGY